MKKIILTEGTEFEQNMKDMALIDTDFREGKPTMLDSDEVNEAFTNADQNVKDKFNFDLNGEEINITPSTSQQVITPSQGKNAITKATVAAVTSAIDSNIVADNIKKDVEILGVTGTYEGSGSSIVPIEDNTVYKKVYLKTENFTIPYTQENILAIEDLIEHQGDYITCVDRLVPQNELLRLETAIHSECLSVNVTAPSGTGQSDPLLTYTYNVDSSEETITVEVSAPSNEAHNMFGIYYSDGITLDTQSNNNIMYKDVLYSTTADIINSEE